MTLSISVSPRRRTTSFCWARFVKRDGYNGRPYPDSVAKPNSRYEGCYIGYPDIDMLTGRQPGAADYHWGELYYGALYDELVAIKHKYDPNKIFQFAMSLGAQPPRLGPRIGGS